MLVTSSFYCFIRGRLSRDHLNNPYLKFRIDTQSFSSNKILEISVKLCLCSRGAATWTRRNCPQAVCTRFFIYKKLSDPSSPQNLQRKFQIKKLFLKKISKFEPWFLIKWFLINKKTEENRRKSIDFILGCHLLM